MKSKEECIADIIRELIEDDDPRAVAAWNEFADENGWERIYSMDEFDDVMVGLSPLDIASMVCCTDFYQHDDWFWFNGNGNVESTNSLEDTDIDPEEMARWAVGTDETFGIDAIHDILGEDWDDDEDEAA